MGETPNPEPQPRPFRRERELWAVVWFFGREWCATYESREDAERYMRNMRAQSTATGFRLIRVRETLEEITDEQTN